jgi:hypothetical protein
MLRSAVNTALRSTQRKLSVEKSVAIFEVNAMAQVNGIAELDADHKWQDVNPC